MVLVTGGAGYIGSHTCVELLNAGYDICVVDNLSNSCEEALNRVKKITGKDFKFYKVDLLDLDGLDKVFSENKIEFVIHFAGLKAVGESVANPLKYFENNVGGAINLLKVMTKYNVKKFVFSSSATVYGDKAPVPYVETLPCAAINPYGRTKLMIEKILQDVYASDNEWDIALLRYFNPVGAHSSGLIGEDPNGIPNNLMPYISQVAVGRLECLNIFGNDYDTKDGTGVRDYIHVVDLAIGHLKALDKIKNKVGVVIYNLGTGQGYSVLDMVNAYSKALGRPINYRFVDRRPGDLAEYYADPSKAERELGFKATRTLDDMCRDTIRWQEGNKNGYRG